MKIPELPNLTPEHIILIIAVAVVLGVTQVSSCVAEINKNSNIAKCYRYQSDQKMCDKMVEELE